MPTRPHLLRPLALCAALAAGCEDVTEMQIDSDSTTANPSSFERSIPEEAVQDDGQGTQTVSEQIAGAERDAVGPPQGESLEGAYNLDDFKGRRVLLVFAGSPEVPAYEGLKASWRQKETDGEIVLVESLLRGQSPEAEKSLPEGENQVMRSRHGIQPAQFKVLLIGEDGRVLAEGDEETSLDEMFTTSGTP